jgi:hypothetical protein
MDCQPSPLFTLKFEAPWHGLFGFSPNRLQQSTSHLLYSSILLFERLYPAREIARIRTHFDEFFGIYTKLEFCEIHVVQPTAVMQRSTARWELRAVRKIPGAPENNI